MLPDFFIDEMLRLQSRHAGLIWRMWENEGVNIEFYLEELALDCSAWMQEAGIAARCLTDTARVTHVPLEPIIENPPKVIDTLQAFLKTYTVL